MRYIVFWKQLYNYSTTLISVLWLISYLEDQLHYLYNKFVQYGKARVQPGLLYFKSKFSNELSSSLAAFKAAHLFVPFKIQEMKSDIANVS